MKYRFQHFHDFTAEQLTQLIDDASGRGQLQPHAKWGWTSLIGYTRAVSVCTIEDDDRNILAKGFVFLRNGHTSKEIRRRITKGRAEVALAGGRKAYNVMKRSVRQSLRAQFSKKKEEPHAAIY